MDQELDSEQSFAAAGASANEARPAARQSAESYFVEAADAGWRFWQPRTLAIRCVACSRCRFCFHQTNGGAIDRFRVVLTIPRTECNSFSPHMHRKAPARSANQSSIENCNPPADRSSRQLAHDAF